MRHNQLKQKIKQGETVLGLFMNCAYPAFIEICGHAGFDFAVIDMEHGPLHPLTTTSFSTLLRRLNRNRKGWEPGMSLC